MHLRRHLLLASALALLAATNAYAQAGGVVDSMTPQSTDLSVQMLDSLFTDKTQGIGSAFAAFLQVVNLVSLAFGVCMFTYMAIVGTLNTAQDGELLGRKWSSMWLPVRFVAVAAVMSPLGSGYSAAQHGMLWLAREGAGAASWAWSAAASHIARGGDSTASAVAPKVGADLDEAMRSIWRAEACVAAFRAYYGQPASFGRTVTRTADDGYVIRWGAIGGSNDISGEACGTLATQTYAPPPQLPMTGFDESGTSVPMASPGSPLVDLSVMSQVTKAELDGALLAADVLSASTLTTVMCGQPASGDVPATPACATDKKAVVEAAISRAGMVYSGVLTPIVSQATSSAGSVQSVVSSLTQQGWVKAGAVMYQLASIESQSSSIAHWSPTVTAPPEGADSTKVLGIAGAGDAYVESWQSGLAVAPSTAMSSVLSPGRSLARWLGTLIGGDPSNPKHSLLQMKNSGDIIMDVCATAMATLGWFGGKVGGAVSAVGDVVGAASWLLGPAGAALKGVLQFGGYVIVPMWAVGIAMSLVIPLQAVTLWIGSVLGWVMAIFEAMLAAPIWLAAHMHPEGEDLSGKGTAGYLILLEVSARPLMMVGGLLAGLAISDRFLRFAAMIWWSSVDSVQSNTITGPVSILVLAMLYCALCFTIIRSAFGMVHDVPTTVMRWIGGQHAVHDKGAQFGQEARQSAGAGTQRGEVMGGHLLKGVSGASGGAAKAAKSASQRARTPIGSIGPGDSSNR